jgi:hypothetical protein
MKEKTKKKEEKRCVMCGEGNPGYKCIVCKKYVCDDCRIEEDICPECAPHSLEEVELEEDE